MRERKYLFPHVIEMNYQAGRRLGEVALFEDVSEDEVKRVLEEVTR